MSPYTAIPVDLPIEAYRKVGMLAKGAGLTHEQVIVLLVAMMLIQLGYLDE